VDSGELEHDMKHVAAAVVGTGRTRQHSITGRARSGEHARTLALRRSAGWLLAWDDIDG
jgi:hypothetical protein